MSGAPVALDRPGARGVRLVALPPLALYVHLPWCERKCPYCDFNSHPASEPVPEEVYVAALLADLEAALPSVWGRRVSSVFLGGGTPSLFSERAIDTLLAALRARLPIAPGCEITLEANPGSAEAAKFRGFRAAGVNRLSLGVQSFDDRALGAIGRIHDGAQAHRAAELARECFERVNIDLMHALPGQTPEGVRGDVRAALAHGATHLSCYQLTIEPGTRFGAHPPPLPGDDAAAAMQQAIEAALDAAGFAHYEVSAWAVPGRECHHNLNYWRFGDYLGIGAGAHSKISFPDRIVREECIASPREYLQRAAAGGALRRSRQVPARELPFEFMMNALRLCGGIETALFAERTGLPIAAAEPALAQAEARGLIVRDALTIRPSALGQRFLNDLLQLFLLAETPEAQGQSRGTPRQ